MAWEVQCSIFDPSHQSAPYHTTATTQWGRRLKTHFIFLIYRWCCITRQCNTLWGKRYLPSSVYMKSKMLTSGQCLCGRLALAVSVFTVYKVTAFLLLYLGVCLIMFSLTLLSLQCRLQMCTFTSNETKWSFFRLKLPKMSWSLKPGATVFFSLKRVKLGLKKKM